MIDYSLSAFAKPVKKQKIKIKLKSHYNPIDKKLKETVLETKGGFCLMGLCENCGGLSVATDLHHYPHKAHGGKDDIDYLWPINRICHSYYHDNPIAEREMFKIVENNGWKVVWK